MPGPCTGRGMASESIAGDRLFTVVLGGILLVVRGLCITAGRADDRVPACKGPRGSDDARRRSDLVRAAGQGLSR